MTKGVNYEEQLDFIERRDDVKNLFVIKKGFVPNMNVEGHLFANENLSKLLFDELKQYTDEPGSFLPALKQLANVAALPGIVKSSIALPDAHSGYGFSIGNVAAFDMDNCNSIVSPGGVGFDINCGVRLLRTNLLYKDIEPVKETLVQKLFDLIPVGVGCQGKIPCDSYEYGMDWSVCSGYSWAEDKEHCEDFGRMIQADPDVVSYRAKKRGLSQIGTLGAGNHYAEVQVVEEVYDEFSAKVMGIDRVGQVCVMTHSGSRGLGHQVASDALVDMENSLNKSKIKVNDKQLACARINSDEGKKYLKAMAAASNYAWVNRSVMTHLTRKAFEEVLHESADDLDMHVVYDVSHNIAKIEDHMIDGRPKRLLLHRKGSTRAFPPYHPLISADFQHIGQPVLVGGTMGTCSYVLTGTQLAMDLTLGSTCHGSGRTLSRNKSRKILDYNDVLKNLKDKGISIRVASPKLVTEEAPESYKDVSEVVQTCHDSGISKKCVKLRPVAVIKGVVAAAAVLLYYVFKNDDEEEEEYDSYKQTYNSSSMSTSRVDKMTRKECFDLLKKIADSQDETKKLMGTLVDELLTGKVASKMLDVYERALPSIPTDPLESKGLTLFDLDHLVDKYQNDPSIRECILNIMNVVPQDDEDLNITLDELIKVHEFMLSELEKLVAAYKKLPHKDSMDKKALTLALQALISARVQDKFGYNYSLIDKAVIKNHSDLSMNTKFARLTMQMQSEMSEITGLYN